MPHMFSHDLPDKSPHHAEIWRDYDLAGASERHAAITMFAATVLFLIGSIMFTVRRSIQVLRDFHLTRL